MKRHPLGFAITVAIAAASVASAFWYVLVVEDLRDEKTVLVTELQATKQRIRSLDAALASYEGKCASKLQAQNRELQERCDKQLSSAIESSKLLMSTERCASPKKETLEKCIAQTDSTPDGRGGGSQWPNVMSRSQCEVKCENILLQAQKYDVWGYCRFGDSDFIWKHKYPQTRPSK